VQVAGAYCQYALFCLLVKLFKIQQTSEGITGKAEVNGHEQSFWSDRRGALTLG
jgi:hypothetical protein